MASGGHEGKARKVVYARSEGRCERCGYARAAEWHHRKNRSGGGLWEPENGLHLCSPCHRWVTEHPLISKEWGWVVSNYAVPADEPVVRFGVWVQLHHDGSLTRLPNRPLPGPWPS